MILDNYSFTYIGARDENQDSIGVNCLGDCGIFTVADGLGSRQHGREASDICVQTLLNEWMDVPYLDDKQCRKEWLIRAVEKANASIIAMQHETKSDMRSTISTLLIDDANAFWANTGDSRVYCIKDNRLYSATEDHSVAYRKYLSGQIRKSQIAFDEDQSSLLKTLGSRSYWEPDIYSTDIKPGDAFFLCTDGIWKYLHDEEILIDSLKARSAEHWMTLLMMRVMERLDDYCDNMSAITLIIR